MRVVHSVLLGNNGYSGELKLQELFVGAYLLQAFGANFRTATFLIGKLISTE